MAPLESDGRNRVAAQPSTADRAGKGSGIDEDVIRKSGEAARALEQCPRTVLGAGRELRATKITDHKCMSREDEPRLIRTGPIRNRQRDVLGRVARYVQNIDCNIAELQPVTIPHPSKRITRLGALVEHVLGIRCTREISPGRVVVGVDVRIDDVLDGRSGVLRHAQVERRRLDRVDDGGAPSSRSPKKVGSGDDWIGMKELSKDHVRRLM